MHLYSSLLDPYEPPRPRRVYDNARVVKRRRSLLSALFEGLRNREVGERVESRGGAARKAAPPPSTREAARWPTLCDAVADSDVWSPRGGFRCAQESERASHSG
jgi:hypothetical protein